MDDFFELFKDFFDKVKDVTNVRFNYMKELYNLGIEQFPENHEILNIQKNNHASMQQGNTKLKKNWTDDDRKVLIWLIGKYMAFFKRDFKLISEADWNKISQMMLRRDGFQCKQKWLQMLKLPLQQAPWSPNEDDALVQIINDFQAQNKGNKWSQIATALNKLSDLNVHRNGKQCRERWNNHLNPSINRNPWQLPEDLELMKLAIQNGKKWALISKKLKLQRSENNVKNRFNCLMRKERSGKNFPQSHQDSDQENDESMGSEPSAEELSQQEVKNIQAIIKKIEWRMKQDGTNFEIKQEDQQEQSQKKIQIDKRQLKIRLQCDDQNQNFTGNTQNANMQSLSNVFNINNNNTNLITSNAVQNGQQMINFSIQDFGQVQYEEQAQLSLCIVNKEKNTLYYATSEQISQYLQRNLSNHLSTSGVQNHYPTQFSVNNYGNNTLVSNPIDNNQQNNLPENMSIPNSMNSFFQMCYQQKQSQNINISFQPQQSQRSVLNLPANLSSSYTQLQNYGMPTYNYHLACYPQQQFGFQQQQHLNNDLQK